LLSRALLCAVLIAEAVAAGAEPLSLEAALEGFEEESGGAPAEFELPLDGFDDAPLPETAGQSGAIETSADSALRGHWLNAAAWNIAHSAPLDGEADYRGLSKLSSKLWLEWEQRLGTGWKLHADGHLRHDFVYQIHGESSYPPAVVERYQQDLEVGELWLSGSLDTDFDWKVGRQIVVWGQSDYLRVNDTLNPLDLREPGLGEIETLRRPLAMVRGDYFRGPWRLTLLAIPEQRPNLTAACGGEFFPSGPRSEAQCTGLARAEQFPQDGLQQMEWGLSAMGRFSGWDLSLYGARLNHDQPYQDPTSATLRYARIDQLGAALNIADGSWLWKGEVAWFDGLDYAAAENRSRLDLLLGGEYRGLSDITLSLEVLRREIGDYSPVLLAEPDYQPRKSWQTLLAYQHDLKNNTLHLKGVVARSGDSLDEGGYSRFSAQYNIDDQWSVSAGGIWYQSGPLPPDWGSSDRLFMELRQDF
jgi:hypothetical protein